MIKVVGCWEFGWNTPFMESNLWRFPLSDFGVDEWIMTPVSGIKSSKVIEFEDIVSVIDSNPELTVVFIDEEGETSLSDYCHPENALYILGRASYSPFKTLKERGESVRIETCKNKGLLWGHQAAGIVLYDRMKKYGNNNN